MQSLEKEVHILFSTASQVEEELFVKSINYI